MAGNTPSLAAEIEALKATYAALNRNDMPGFVKYFSEDMEWIEFEGTPGGGTYRGKEAVGAHAAEARATWAEGSCAPERFIVAGDKVVVLVHVRVRLKHETEWREGRLADVYTFRDGKATQARVFFDRAEGLEWAGVDPSEVS